jgi:hypothetical protein
VDTVLTMADFFGGINNIAKPDVIMNSGPLPPTNLGGAPPGFNGIPDGKINDTSTLLGDMHPYSYGGPARPGTQNGTLNIPHIVQRIIPSFELPEPSSQHLKNWIPISHGVCDGDIAFTLRAAFGAYPIIKDRNRLARRGNLNAVDVIVNLQTANYILRGLQEYLTSVIVQAENWGQLYLACGLDHYIPPSVLPILQSSPEYERMVDIITRQIIRPFGVPKGSDKQGGQHQGTHPKTVTWPVDHVLSFIVDGKCTNLMNFWRDAKLNVHAGDDFILTIVKKPWKTYELTSHSASMVTRSFGADGEFFQYVPDVRDREGTRREYSFWHIARSEIQLRPYTSASVNLCTTASAMTNGKLIECFWQPVFNSHLAQPPVIGGAGGGPAPLFAGGAGGAGGAPPFAGGGGGAGGAPPFAGGGGGGGGAPPFAGGAGGAGGAPPGEYLVAAIPDVPQVALDAPIVKSKGFTARTGAKTKAAQNVADDNNGSFFP